MVTLHYLADHPHLLTVLADWPLGDSGTLRRDLELRLHRYRLPLAFVALVGDRPTGCVSLLLDRGTSPPKRRPRLEGLYVVSEHRGRGIGTALARRSVRKAAALGHPELSVSAPPGYAAFFERLGWRPEPETGSMVVRTHARRSSVLCSV